jgi:anti-sigma regulatory factor (Ser/Thr protein kinase)
VGTPVLTPPPQAHAVSFYEHDHELAALLARFVDEGLALGERVIVVTTPEHAAAFDTTVRARGIDPDAERAAGRLVTVDARATLDSFLRDGTIDPDEFETVVARVLRGARADGCRVRAFGEMVALLWEIGDVAGALELEECWTLLQAEIGFDLLCAYPTSALGDARLGDVNDICEAHNSVLPPASYATGTPAADATIAEYSQVFLPVPEAVAAVRRFVNEVLVRWGERDLVTDATLVSSELATNAVLHASSPFRVSVDRSVGVVCIAIQDVAIDAAAPQDSTIQDDSGRGMMIVEALARRWGCDPLPTGKVVWAELATTSTDA